MKRVITFLMVLALVLSLGVTALAAGGDVGSITINNAIIDAQYAVYKIFDATYDTNGHVTYTIQPGDEFFTELFGAGGTTANDYFVYHADTHVVTRNTETGKTDAELFAYLAGLVEGNTATATKTATSTSITFGDLENGYLPTGYYVIHRPYSPDGSDTNAVTITTTKPHADVNDKNELPGGDFDKSSSKDQDYVTIGEEIDWTIQFTATHYAGEEKVWAYTVTDNLNRPWAALDLDSIEVYVDTTKLDPENGEWTLETPASMTDGFKIRIPWVNTDTEGNFDSFKYPVTAVIKVTYSGIVLDEAAANDPANPGNKNQANPGWEPEGKPEVPGTGDGTESDVYNLGFTKVDGTTGNGLAGAKFELYRNYDEITKEYSNPVTLSVSATGVYIVDANSESNVVETPATGVVVITGLEDLGTYYLKEIEAPDGYNALTAPVIVTVVADVVDEHGNVTEPKGTYLTANGVSYYVNHAKVDVQNFSGVELPSTGGAGTVMLISFGTMVAVAFAILMITQKKMSIYRD